jgi:hypothetical protein
MGLLSTTAVRNPPPSLVFLFTFHPLPPFLWPPMTTGNLPPLTCSHYRRELEEEEEQ